MKNIKWKNNIPIIILIIFAICFPLMGIKPYYLHIAIISLIYILLATGLNIVVGYVGQLSLGQAAFYGIGAYTSALLSVNFNVPFYLTLPISTIVAAFFGFLLGAPTLRLKGPYLVIATISFNEMIRLTFLNWSSLTNGPNGIVGISAPVPIKLGLLNIDFSKKIHYYYLYLIIVTVIIIISRNILVSRVGRAFKANREDNIAAEVMGINLPFYKVFAFSIGAAFAGMAGSMFVHYVRFVSPESFATAESINILIMVVMGGMGTISGPIIGAVTINYLLETMRFLQQYRLIIYGVVLFIIILVMPKGLMGLVEIIREGIEQKKAALSRKAGVGNAS